MMPGVTQRLFNGVQQLVHASALLGRNGHHILPHRDLRGGYQIGFVIAPQHRRAGLGELGDQLIHHGDVLLPVRIGSVNHMKQHIGVLQLLQCRPERFHQMMGQLGNKAHRVGQNHVQIV